MNDAARPVPHVTDANRPFWDGTREGRLLVQRCGTCSRLRFPPAPFCDDCLSEDVAWTLVSGHGVVWSVCEFHRPYFKGLEVPYNVALVLLDEGPRLYTNIVGMPFARIQIGMRVEAVFDPVTDEAALVRFRPVEDGAV